MAIETVGQLAEKLKLFPKDHPISADVIMRGDRTPVDCVIDNVYMDDYGYLSGPIVTIVVESNE